MASLHLQTTIGENGTLTLKGLPLPPGRKVDVIVRDRDHAEVGNDRFPLRGKPIKYRDPFESVAENDWNASN